MASGPRNARWRGGVWITSKGYRWLAVPVDHPCNRAGRKGYAPEHLLVFWQAYGRFPYPGFEIHHKDEDKLNNALDNLEEREKADHGRAHLTPERAAELGRKGGKAAARARLKRRRKKRKNVRQRGR